MRQHPCQCRAEPFVQCAENASTASINRSIVLFGRVSGGCRDCYGLKPPTNVHLVECVSGNSWESLPLGLNVSTACT